MARSGLYRLEIPDLDYWRRQVKCQWACPVGTDARGYVLAVAAGDDLEAYRLARAWNPFASICGWVCGAPCEAACRRGRVDEPVVIRALKRFATERHGVEAVAPEETIAFSAARRDPENPCAGTPVAVIGAGVGGLTAAHDLALLGYRVTVFERESFAGGMLVTGVPLYRLSRELVRREIAAIESLGVELRLGVEVGRDVTLDGLQAEGYRAILIAVGLQRSRRLSIPGVDLHGVLHGIEFLREVNLGGEVDLGRRVVVVGGGNVAFDVARTVVRCGVDEVHLVCLESREEMPADEIEIIEGVEEGIRLHVSRGPAAIVAQGGAVAALQTQRVLSVFDEEGRFRPRFAEEPGETIPADTVIFAIGQAADFGFLEGVEGVEVTPRGTIGVDPRTCRTAVPHIFACGDVAEGANLFIHAIASGQRAARAIDAWIRGLPDPAEEPLSGRFEDPGAHCMPEGYLQRERENPPVRGAAERAASTALVELSYEERVARLQGDRCLRCHVDTIFNGAACILCGGCVDVCPTSCLALVPLDRVALEGELRVLVERRYGVDLDVLLAEGGPAALRRLGSVMIKDEERCVRCGFCADRCPTRAVTMEHFRCEPA